MKKKENTKYLICKTHYLFLTNSFNFNYINKNLIIVVTTIINSLA